jgi:hypothetical protein
VRFLERRGRRRVGEEDREERDWGLGTGHWGRRDPKSGKRRGAEGCGGEKTGVDEEGIEAGGIMASSGNEDGLGKKRTGGDRWAARGGEKARARSFDRALE